MTAHSTLRARVIAALIRAGFSPAEALALQALAERYRAGMVPA